ncbi:MAG: phospholipase D-like domain-containing protein [Leptospirales bacterium]
MVKNILFGLCLVFLLFLTFPVFLSCQVQAPAQPGSFDVFYSRPGEQSDAEDRIVLFIGKAEKTIFMTMYNFDSERVREALLRARQSGVEVKLVGDLDESDSNGYQALLLDDVDLVVGNTTGIQHNKFIVIDSKTVLTGTGNFTQSGFYYNDNNFIIIKSTALASWYEEEFFRMRAGFFARLKSSPFIDKTTMVSGSKVSLYFSPTDSAQTVQKVVEAIGKAENSIRYMVFAFSHDEISSALIEASRRGVKVYGIHDSNFVSGISQEASRLYRASVLMPRYMRIRIDGNENYVPDSGTNVVSSNSFRSGSKMHCKTMLIDADTDSGVAITGSFNWSQNAVHNNDENLLLIHNSNVSRSLLNQWKLAWQKSTTMKYVFSTTFGSAAKSGDVQITEVGWYGEVNGSNDSGQKFIELKNLSGKNIDVTNWTIAWRSQGFRNTYTIPDLYTSSYGGPFNLAPGELFIIYTRDADILNETFGPGRSFVQSAKIPSSKDFTPFPGDPRLSLYDPTMKLIDSTGKMAPVYYSLETNGAAIRSQVKMGKNGHWRASTTPCAALCSSLLPIYATPGMDELFATPLEFGTVTKKQSGNITVQFSADVSACVDKSDYTVSGSGTPAIDQVYSGDFSNELVFQLSGANNSQNLYSISANTAKQGRTFAITSLLNEIYMAGDAALYYSSDSGANFTRVTLAPWPIRVHDISFHAGSVYLATSDGIYTSTSPGNFVKEVASPFKVRHLAFTTTSRYTSGNFGLYRNSGSGFVKVISEPMFSLAAKNNTVIAGTGQSMYYSNDDGVSFNVAAGVTGPVWDVAITDTKVIAATGAGLFFSDNNGADFYKFSGVSNPDQARFRIATTPARVYVASQDNIAIIEAGLATEVPLPIYNGVYNGKKVFPEKLFARLNSLWIASSAGLFVSSDAGLTFSHTERLCNGSAFPLPTGGVTFNGFSSIETAKVEFNEIMLKPTSGPQWLEITVSQDGTLNGISIQYMQGYGAYTIFVFPDVAVVAGQILLIYMDPESAAELSVYSNLYYGSTSFVSRFSPLTWSDGILLLKTKDQWREIVYYTNKDGHITSSLMKGGMLRLYANVGAHQFMSWNSLNPISGFNDAEIQKLGINISDVPNGFSLNKSLTGWKAAPATPGAL